MAHAHFQGLAQLNMYYLYWPKMVKPAEHTAVLADKLQGEVLQKFLELPVVEPLLEGSGTILGFIFSLNVKKHCETE